jgi:hypothetical protein
VVAERESFSSVCYFLTYLHSADCDPRHPSCFVSFTFPSKSYFFVSRLVDRDTRRIHIKDIDALC